MQTFSEIFKGNDNDIKLTLNINEKQFIKFLVIHDDKIQNSEFMIENDFINKAQLGDIKQLMVSNNIDYDEQMKREQEKIQKEQEKLQNPAKKIFQENNGICELDESDSEEIILEEMVQKNNLKRPRKEDKELEIIGEKPLKHIKID